MTKARPRFDSHVSAFRDLEARRAADQEAAKDRAANLPFFFSLKTSDSYATIWDSAHDAARPVGTITRPRLFGEARAKLWTVSATDGVNVWQSALRPSAMQATRALIRHEEKKARAADLARLVQSAKEAQALAAEVDSALAALDAAEEEAEGFDGMATSRDWTRKAAPRPFDLAPADIYGPGEATPADLKARRASLWAAFALAPIAPQAESPLCPSRPALARLAALHAGAF